jgi:hypothetical protein
MSWIYRADSVNSSPHEVTLDPALLPFTLRQWIAESRYSGMTRHQLTQALESRGISEEAVLAEIQRQDAEPCFRVGYRLAENLRNLEAVLDTCNALRALSPTSGTVHRRSRLTRAAFRDKYYASNLPIVLTDVSTGWPALTRWTPDYLRSVVGSADVEVMENRTEGRLRDVDSPAQTVIVPFDEFVDALKDERHSRELYLVGNNRFMDTAAAGILWGDFGIDERYLDPTKARECVCFWFGPRATVTPLHRDLSNILFCQIRGRKRFTLISPFDSHRVYNEVGVFSEVDCEDPDLERFPRFSAVQKQALVLDPGDALFIPVGWWHRVEALDAAMSLSFTNFVFQNTFG